MKLFMMFLIFSTTIFPHPHVFMEADVKLDIEERILKGIHYNINLDEMSSALLSMRYTFNSEGTLITDDGEVLDADNYPMDEAELEAYKVRFNGKDVKNLKVKLDKVYMDDMYFTYEIYIPLNINIKEGDKLNLSIYDKNFFFDYYYDEFSIKLMDGSKLPYNFFVKENKDITFYMDLMNPIEYEVIF